MVAKLKRSTGLRSRVEEAREEGLVLVNRNDKTLSWRQTYRDTGRHKEDWSDTDSTLADGLDDLDR